MCALYLPSIHLFQTLIRLALSRTRKELDRYKEEMDNQRVKIETMRTEGRDEFDIRQQSQVFNETERVIPDTLRRLQKAVDELVEFLVRTKSKCFFHRAINFREHHLPLSFRRLIKTKRASLAHRY